MTGCVVGSKTGSGGDKAEKKQSKTYHFGLNLGRNNHGTLCAGDCTRGSVFYHAMDQETSVRNGASLCVQTIIFEVFLF